MGNFISALGKWISEINISDFIGDDSIRKWVLSVEYILII